MRTEIKEGDFVWFIKLKQRSMTTNDILIKTGVALEDEAPGSSYVFVLLNESLKKEMIRKTCLFLSEKEAKQHVKCYSTEIKYSWDDEEEDEMYWSYYDTPEYLNREAYEEDFEPR